MAFEEHDEETPLLSNHPNLNGRKFGLDFRARFQEQLDPKDCIPILVVLNFITGFLDAISYTTLRVWAAFQTGNSLQLSLALSRLTARASEIPASYPSRLSYAFTTSDRVAIASLAFFNLGALAGSYIVNSTTRRTRGWMAVSTVLQMLLTAAGALLLARPGSSDAQEVDATRRYISLVLIAISLGVQGTQAKKLGPSQFGTSLVLTTAWVDLMNGPLQVARFRDHKVLPIVSLILGGFVGGTILRYAGAAVALGIIAVLRALIVVGWFVVSSDHGR